MLCISNFNEFRDDVKIDFRALTDDIILVKRKINKFHNMEIKTTVNQSPMNYESMFLERMKAKYPDRNFDSENSENGRNSLAEALMQTLDEGENIADKFRALSEKTDALSNLLNKSPRASTFLTTLAVTGDPSAAIYKAYGKDAYEAFKEGDASEFIKNIEESDAKAREEDKQLQKQKEENFQKSMERLDKWGDGKGLSTDDKINVFLRFHSILSDALMGNYSEELFEMGWKADHYSQDVENARREGEIAGRNAKIEAQRIARNKSQMMPPSLDGQGVRQTESMPGKKEDPWMLD